MGTMRIQFFYFIMKKNYCVIFLCLLSLVFSSACSDDNDDNKDGGINNENMSLLLGTWEEVNRESYKDGEVVPDHWAKWAKWAFQKDGTLIHFSPTYTDKGTYEYNGAEKWIRLKYHGENKKVTIQKLTDEELVWKANYPDDEYDYQILYLKKTTSEYDDSF